MPHATETAISCVVPVYNGARYLSDALDSIFRQSHAVAEVIVVDDGSTDSSAEVVAAYPEPVRYVRQPNAGPASARNHGISLARGDLLAFLDADDLWHEDKLARQIARFVARPELECCLSFKRQFWEGQRRLEEAELRRQGHPITRDAPGWVMQTMLVRASTFHRVGPLDEQLRLGEDTDWFVRAEDLGVITEMIEEALVYRRLHDNNLSSELASERGTADRLRIALKSVRRKRALD